MTENFYVKAQVLQGEFQKRELHYLNAERKLRSSMMHKKELNLPFQEYLQKINQREKETEETYRNIMKQMENLDRQTDSMTLKLEKLGILRNSLAIPLQRWTSSAGSNLQMYSTPLNYDSKMDHFSLESVESNVKSASEISFQSELTQTEDIYCEECGYLLQNQFNPFLKNASPSVLNNSSVVNDKSPDMHSRKYQDDSYTLSEDHIHSQFGTSSVNSVLPTVLVNTDKSFIGENHEVEQQVMEKSYRKNSIKELNERRCSVENMLKSKEVAPINTSSTTDQNEEKVIGLQQFESENYESKSADDEPSVNTFVSKSDAESMNNEFDFLESDTRNKSSKKNTKVEKSPSYDFDASFNRVPNSIEDHSKDLPSKQKENKNITHSNLKLELSDNKSESSGSVSGPHSPNISVASDSDSSFRKGSPLNASAAYQALLGNTIIPQNINKGNSDSDTEDEVEKALANVAQRSSVKSKSSIQTKPASSVEPKTIPQTADIKPAVRGSKPPSVNKPQSKLSKSTRKVLGLDTSSGSEGELAVKPPEKKIDEDSDEFDFYD